MFPGVAGTLAEALAEGDAADTHRHAEECTAGQPSVQYLYLSVSLFVYVSMYLSSYPPVSLSVNLKRGYWFSLVKQMGRWCCWPQQAGRQRETFQPTHKLFSSSPNLCATLSQRPDQRGVGE